jgi:malonyl-CoA/methylmalonyl-CoA synthetase
MRAMHGSSFLSRFLAIPDARVALRFDPDVAAASAFPAGQLTYGALRDRGARVAGWLRERGVGPGDRVAIQLENSLDLIDAHLGCMALGAVRVPLNAHYRAAEVRPIVEDAAPVLVIARDPSLYEGLGVRVERQPGHGAPAASWVAPADDVTCLLFTSGTTGRSKAAPQTWGMWTANLDALAARWELSEDDRLRLVLPLFHTHGLVVGLHGALLRGASADVGARFEPAPFAPGVTHFYGVPTFYHRWVGSMRRDDFRDVRLLVSGSDGLPAALSDAVQAATGLRILERYGMTETVMIASNPFHGERRAGTVGTPLDGVDVRIVDDEVQVRGPSVFGGYAPRAGAASEVVGADAFTMDGYFRTGDAGVWDEAGYLRIVGRKKDLVIVGGVNVSPAEVEAVLRAAPGVADVAVCGLPDDDLGEVVAAAVVSDGTRDTDALRVALDAVAQELSGLKRPRRWSFVESLPRNALGKVQRARVRADVFGA